MKNWIWIHPNATEGAEDWKRQFALMRECGLHAVSAIVYTGRHALYGSSLHPVVAPLLEQMIPLATDAGLELHAWIVCLRCNADSVHRVHPDWFSVSRNGESSLDKPPYIPSYQWLCPSRPEVREWLCGTVAELGSYDGLTGVHLDYIRHPDVILPAQLQPKYGLVQDREFPKFDFCYCDVCREAFGKLEGIDPLHIEDPPAHEAWARFRHASVRDTVALAAATARGAGKAVTAAVFATPKLARGFVRQDWPSWDLDGVLPMIYHNYYDRPASWIAPATREGVDALAGKMPLYSGLFVRELTPQQLSTAVEESMDAGASGIALFSGGAVTDDHWSALRTALT